MQYDFDQVIERRNTRSSKWDNVGARVGNPNALPMWVADMDFRSPQPVIDALRERVELGIFGYPFAHQDFFQEVVQWQKRRHGWEVGKSSVLYVSSVIPAMFSAVQCLTKPGDKVLIMRPVYYPFTHAIEDNGRVVANCPLVERSGHYEIDFEALETIAADPDVKLMLLCNPHNPVGRVFTREQLINIGKICLKYNVLIFSDEIHGDIVYSDHMHIPIASLSSDISQITVTAVAPSKTFNLAGLRTAAVIAENEHIHRRLAAQFDSNKCALVSTFGLDGCIAAYRYGEEYLEQLLVYLQGNIDFLDGYLKSQVPKIRLIRPEGTFLMWLDCRELGMSDADLDDFFTQRAEVALDKGVWFGTGEGTGFMRMNIACPRSTLENALEKIKGVYRTL